MELSDLDAVTPGKHLFGCSSIFQHDNDPKHSPSAVKAHLDRKTLSAIDWSPQSRVGSYWQRNPPKAAITQKLECPAEIFLLYKLCGVFALYTVVPYMFTRFNRFLNLFPIFLAKSKQIGSDFGTVLYNFSTHPLHFIPCLGRKMQYYVCQWQEKASRSLLQCVLHVPEPVLGHWLMSLSLLGGCSLTLLCFTQRWESVLWQHRKGAVSPHFDSAITVMQTKILYLYELNIVKRI